MAQLKKDARREIAHYAHADKEHLNNPPVGLVTPGTDRDTDKKGSIPCFLLAGFSDLCVRRVFMQLSRPSPVKVL